MRQFRVSGVFVVGALLMAQAPINPSNGGGANAGPAISSGDQAGSITLANGVASRTFDGTYVNAPVCTGSDQSALAPVRITSTNTVMSVTGTGADTIAYHCDFKG